MRVRAFFRLVAPRYRALNTPPFVVGAVTGGAAIAVYLPLGIAAIFAWAITQELANKLTDRSEDAVDYPERGRLYELVGHRNLQRLFALAIVVFAALWSAMLVFADAPWRVLVGWGLLMAWAVGYSFGPRIRERAHADPRNRRRHVRILFTIGALWFGVLILFDAPLGVFVASAILFGIPDYLTGPRMKERKYSGLLLIAAAPPLFLQMGWRYSDDPVTAPFLAAIALLLVAGVSLMFAKDSPNVDGDASIGYRSIYLRLKGADGAWRTRLLVSLPYLLAVTLVATGTVGTSYLMVLFAAPAGIAFCRAMARAGSQEEREVVRELGALNKIAITNAILFSFSPAPLTAALAVGAFAWYLSCTWWLHSEPGMLDRRRLAIAAGLAIGRTPERAPTFGH